VGTAEHRPPVEGSGGVSWGRRGPGGRREGLVAAGLAARAETTGVAAPALSGRAGGQEARGLGGGQA
jgi:hypothetical protein